jgi:hypothetical protein
VGSVGVPKTSIIILQQRQVGLVLQQLQLATPVSASVWPVHPAVCRRVTMLSCTPKGCVPPHPLNGSQCHLPCRQTVAPTAGHTSAAATQTAEAPPSSHQLLDHYLCAAPYVQGGGSACKRTFLRLLPNRPQKLYPPSPTAHAVCACVACREMVALVGAHTLGRCHTDRSGFKGPWTNAPTTFSNLYFQELANNKW